MATHTPDYWRKRAEQFRTKSGNCESDQTASEFLGKLATTFDDLARLTEQIRNLKKRKRLAIARPEAPL
jgi:hypothetical protein